MIAQAVKCLYLTAWAILFTRRRSENTCELARKEFERTPVVFAKLDVRGIPSLEEYSAGRLVWFSCIFELNTI